MTALLAPLPPESGLWIDYLKFLASAFVFFIGGLLAVLVIFGPPVGLGWLVVKFVRRLR